MHCKPQLESLVFVAVGISPHSRLMEGRTREKGCPICSNPASQVGLEMTSPNLMFHYSKHLFFSLAFAVNNFSILFCLLQFDFFLLHLELRAATTSSSTPPARVTNWLWNSPCTINLGNISSSLLPQPKKIRDTQGRGHQILVLSWSRPTTPGVCLLLFMEMFWSSDPTSEYLVIAACDVAAHITQCCFGFLIVRLISLFEENTLGVIKERGRRSSSP